MLKIKGGAKVCEKGGDYLVNDFDEKKKDKDSKYTYKSIHLLLKKN